jgi:hypothetical protein
MSALVKDLEWKDFEINPYDSCVVNKMIEGKQFDVTWYIDDLKMSHMEEGEVTNVIDWLESIYGEMRVSRGNVHAYLGMTFDFETPGEVKVTMIDYLKWAIINFPEVITGSTAIPAGYQLLEVGPNQDESKHLLDETRAQAFHHAVAQLVFALTRAQKDIHTTIAFLTTRARLPYEYGC